MSIWRKHQRRPCPTCDGRGWLYKQVRDRNLGRTILKKAACSRCRGRGWV